MIEMAKLLADPEIRDSMQSLAKSMQRLQINPAVRLAGSQLAETGQETEI